MANQVWKPTKEDAVNIRNHAKDYANSGWVKVELGLRCKLRDDSVPYSANYMLVGGFEESDLADFISWADFLKKGVELNPCGNAALDFYVSDRNGLVGNIGVHISAGKITKLD